MFLSAPRFSHFILKIFRNSNCFNGFLDSQFYSLTRYSFDIKYY